MWLLFVCRSVQLPSRSLWSAAVHLQTWGASQSPAYTPSSPPSSHSQQGHKYICQCSHTLTPWFDSSLLLLSFTIFSVACKMSLSLSLSLQCDPALLPEPNHVMLNHLYALSIKVGSPETAEILLTLSQTLLALRKISCSQRIVQCGCCSLQLY